MIPSVVDPSDAVFIVRHLHTYTHVCKYTPHGERNRLLTRIEVSLGFSRRCFLERFNESNRTFRSLQYFILFFFCTRDEELTAWEPSLWPFFSYCFISLVLLKTQSRANFNAIKLIFIYSSYYYRSCYFSLPSTLLFLIIIIGVIISYYYRSCYYLLLSTYYYFLLLSTLSFLITTVNIYLFFSLLSVLLPLTITANVYSFLVLLSLRSVFNS